MGKLKRLFQYLSFGIIIGIVLFSSCEIGLGSSVDTDSPTIEIVNPSSGVTIRDEFCISGKWDDDGEIKSLILSLTLVDSNGKSGSNAAITKEGSVSEDKDGRFWTCVINPVEEGIKDGTYEIKAVISDSAGHSTTITRQITLDNTAPVVVLQRPSTEKGAAVKDSYGQSFTIEGQAADDNNISHIDVKIYSGETLLDTVRLNNVPPTISLDVAKFLDEHYTKIYGSTEKEGTKEFWCEIEAYDGAQRYPADGSNQSAADTEGNCEKEYYLYDEIKTSVLSGHKITELYKMKCGTYSTTTGERSVTDEQSAVEELLKGKKKSSGSFTLNPDNSPSFRVNGRDALKEGENNFSDTTNNLTNGGELICEVSPGLDGIPLVADSLKLYAVECDEYGKAKEGAEKIYPEEYQAKEKSSSSYKFFNVFNRSAGFVFGKTYVLGFEGKDESGNGVAANGYAYGFKFATSGTSPIIRISEPDEDAEIYVKKGGKLKIKGSVETESGIADLKLSVNGTGFEVKDEDVSEGSGNLKLYKSLTDGGESEFEYEIDFDSEANKAIFSQSVSKKYILRVTATQGKPSETGISFTYDVDGPVVKGYSASPVVNGNTINGSPVFAGEFRDEKSGVKSVKYRIEKKEGGNWVTAQDEAELSSPEDFSFTVDTRAINDSESSTTNIRIVFEAEDKAGNISETAYEYTVDQASDRPKIESSSGSFDETVSSYEILRSIITNKERRNLYTKGSTLAVKVSDDDGLMNKSGSGESSVSGVTVTLTANSSNDAATFTEGEVKTDALEINGNPESTTLTYTLPEVSGSYKVEIKAKDKAGVVPTCESEKTFYIQITGAAPDARVSATPEYITTNTADLDESLKKTAFEVKVEITDGTGPFTVNRGETSIAVKTTTEDPSLEYPTAGETFTPEATDVVNGRGSITYTVRDNYGNTKNVIFDYKVDNDAPEAGIDETSWPTKEDTERSSYTFRGSSADKGSIQSGVAKTEISFDGGNTLKTASGNWSYNAVFEDEGLIEGGNELWVRAADNAGNRGSWTKKSFVYDKSKPKLESIKYKRSVDSEYAEVDESGIFESGSVFRLKIKASDTNGIKHIAVYEKEGEGEENLAGEYTASAAHEREKEWELAGLPKKRDTDGSALKTGSYTYRIVTYDVSGATDAESKYVEKTITVNIDLAGPQVEITSPDPDDRSILSEDTYLFGGTVQDGGGEAAVGVSKVYYAIKESEGEPADGEWKELTKESTGSTKVNWKTDAYTLKEGKVLTASEETDGKVLSEGHYWLYVKAADKAGNASVVKSAEFYADKAKPGLSWISEPETNYTEETGSAVEIAVKAEDTNGIESIKLKKDGAEESDAVIVSLIAAADENYEKNKDTKKKVSKSYAGLEDGEYTFLIETEDKAERSAKLEKKITVDTKKPEIKRVKAGSVELEGGKWYKSKTLTVEITARDEKKNGYASGISAAEFSTDGGATWGAFTKGSDVEEDGAAYNTYRGPVEFADVGENTIKIKLSDKGGNTSWYGSEAGITIYIDESPASLERSKYEIGGYESAEDTIYINGEKDLTVYGTYSDGESGVGALSLSYQDGSEIAAGIRYAKADENGVISGEYEEYSTYDTLEKRKEIGFWKAEIGKTALAALKDKTDGKSRLVVKGVNGAGSETTLNGYSLVWDKTSPSITGITLKYSKSEAAAAGSSVYKDTEGKYFINPEGKWITVSGNAGDSNGLAKIYYSTDGKALTQSGKSWSELVIGTNGKSADGYTRESWGFAKIQLSGEDGEVKNIDIKAEDKAGNTATARERVQIDKSAPLALHLIDESGKDLYFRVGSSDNDENEGIENGDAAFGNDDKDVGGKYSDGTFGSDSTIWIRGSFIDVCDGESADVENGTKGSGVKNVYYEVYETESEAKSAAADSIKNTGKIVSLKSETKRVFFTGNEQPGSYELKKNNVADRRKEGSEVADPYVKVTSEGYLAAKANGTAAKKHWTSITTTYKDSVTGFNEGTNYLVLVAEDNAGNIAKDTIRLSAAESHSNYSLNVDTQVPKITSGTTDTVYTNLKDDLVIRLTATDTAKKTGIDPAGIRSVVIEVEDNKIKEEETGNVCGTIEYLDEDGNTVEEKKDRYVKDDTDEDGKKYSEEKRKVTLTKNAFKKDPAKADDVASNWMSGNITVYATVSDDAGAGNSQRVSVATVNVDKKAPEVTINEISDADDDDKDHTNVNGILEIKGSANDDNALGAKDTDRIRLYYIAADSTIETDDTNGKVTSVEGWSEYKAIGQTSSWSIELNTTEKKTDENGDETEELKFSDTTEYYLCATAVDKAGNTGYSKPVKVYVDQDSDRPKIRFSNIELSNDDGDMSSDNPVWLKNTNELTGTISDDDGIKDKKFWYSTDSWSTPKEVTVNNGGSWKINLTDGEYTVEFKVTDTKGTTFTSGTSPDPKLKDEEKTLDGKLYINVDKTSPVTRSEQYSIWDGNAEEPAYTAWGGSLGTVGGKRTKFQMKLEAGDENKVKGVSLSFTVGEGEGAKTYTYSGTKTVEEPADPGVNDNGKYYSTWEIRDIDVAAKDEFADADKQYNGVLIVEDNAGLKKEDRVVVRIDNEKPSAGFDGPDSDKASSADIVVYGSTTGIPVEMSYALSKNDGSHKTSYLPVKGFGSSWRVNLDRKDSTETETHSGKTANDYLVEFGITTQTALEDKDHPFDEITNLKFWIKSRDEVGNENEQSHVIKVDPQGDRPEAAYSYPETSGITMGGKVKVYGTAQDTKGSDGKIGVDSVWVQIKAGTSSFSGMTKADLDFMLNSGYSVFKMKDYDVTKSEEENSGCRWTSESTDTNYKDYAALAELNGAAWSVYINRNKELDPAGTEEEKTKDSVIRIFARDKDTKFSPGVDRMVTFDADMPVISELMLVQKEGGSTTASKAYTSDMFVKGTWYLEGKAKDDDKIGKIKISINGTEHILGGDGTKSEETFSYELPTGSGVGKLNITLEAEDVVDGGDPHKTEEKLTICYDNQEPDVQNVLETGADGNAINVCQSNGWYTFGSTAKEPAVLSGTDYVSQSGYAYTAFYFRREYTINGTKTEKIYDVLRARDDAAVNLADKTSLELEEGGEGLWWYKKSVARDENNLNVLDFETEAGINAVRKNSLIKIGGSLYLVTGINGTKATIDGYPGKEFSDAYVAVAGIVDNTTPEAAPSSGSVEADGYYAAPSRDDGDRMIESVLKSGTDWTWEANICSKNIPDGPVELIYVVFDKAGNFKKKNITGNVSNNQPRLAGVTIKTDYDNDDKFEGTDEVINKYSAAKWAQDYVTENDSETDTAVRYDPDKNSKNLNKKNLLPVSLEYGKDKPLCVLKGRTEIIPEIVGGNDAIYYSYDIGGTVKGINTTALIEKGSIDYTAKSGTINVQAGDLIKAGNTTGAGGRKFSFVFYDSTEGSYWTKAGNYWEASEENPDDRPDSREAAKIASLDLWFKVQIKDVAEPSVGITPLYWKGLNENSIYGSAGIENTAEPESSIAAAESYEDLLGHIELSSDWESAEGYTSATSELDAALKDNDAKVSGKIVLEGTAHDDKLLKQINASIFETEVTLAVPVSTTDANLKSNTGTDFGDDGYYFEIVEGSQSIGATGHDLSWKLYIDTEVIGGALLDAAVTVTAVNYGEPTAPAGTAYTSIDGKTQYGALTYAEKTKSAELQMDIVPYVTEVTTSLSAHDSNNPSVYARTALGHYPVYATHAQGKGGYTYEQGIKLKGFNLTDCKVVFEDGITSNTLQEKNASGTNVNYNKEAALSASDGVYSFDLPNGARSGKVSVYRTVGGKRIQSLNNFNSNNAHGVNPDVDGSGFVYTGTIPAQGNKSKYDNFYNRIPNGINNNNLTDDLVFDVWDLNSEAAKAYGDGKADNAVMKINPVSGMIGFAFSNSSERFSMGGTVTAESNTEYSYRQWNMTFDYMNYNYFTYDSSGHSYGTTSGGDISADETPRWDFYSLMSDRWGRVGEASGANKRNAGGGYYGNGWDANLHDKLIRPEGIGQAGNATTTSTTRNRTNSRIRKDRIQSTSIATLRHGNDSTKNATYIYLAYFDVINKEIRFRAGDIRDSDTSVPDKNTQLSRYGSLIDVCTKQNNGFASYAQTADTCQIMATNTTGSISNGKYDQSKTFGSAGNAVALGVTSSNVVVMVWNDGNNNLKIAYNTTPQTLHLGATKDGWTGYTTLISGAGEYCQLVVDGNDNIHVVAYNNGGLDLKYAFVPKMVDDNSKNVPNIGAAKTCDVDTYDNVGSRLSLDVAKEGDNYIPHIGYWGAYPAAPRYAYLADPETFYGTNGDSDDAIKARSGAVSDMYTGVWECGVVPTNMGVKQGKVNVGVWKYDVDENNKGKRVASNYSGFTVSKNKKSTNSSAENDRGFCYGNATDNAVLAYVVMPSSTTYHIETAQMR